MNKIIMAMTIILGIIFIPGERLEGQVYLTDVQGIWISAEGGKNVNGFGSSQINWGITNGQQSGYIFAPMPSLFPVDVDLGVNFDVAKFTHNNFVVQRNSSIKGAALATNLTFLVDGQQVNVSRVYNFKHNETLNTGLGCCDDIVSGINNTPFTEEFIVGHYLYTFEIQGFTVNGELFSDFTTRENQANDSVLVAEITRVHVPEPSTYILLGSMLALIVFFRKRRGIIKN